MLSGDDDGNKDDHLIVFKRFVIVVTIAKLPLHLTTTQQKANVWLIR